VARVEVISGPERRRRWSVEQKRAIVAESLAPGAVVTEVARRAEICPGRIYRWRQEIGVANGFAKVLIAPVADGAGCPTTPALDAELSVSARAALAILALLTPSRICKMADQVKFLKGKRLEASGF
jgi:transposase